MGLREKDESTADESGVSSLGEPERKQCVLPKVEEPHLAWSVPGATTAEHCGQRVCRGEVSDENICEWSVSYENNQNVPRDSSAVITKMYFLPPH